MTVLRVTIATLLTFLLATSVATAAPEPVRYERYVALGDSYTAGPGVPTPRLDRLACFTSTNNYPALLAGSLGLPSYTDGSCSGADTTNMLQPQSSLIPLVPLGQHPPQFGFLRADTDLVTIGIGGNDFDVFGDLTMVCPVLRAFNPTGSPCRDKYTVDGADTMKEKIGMTKDRVRAVLGGVHERSPKAKVLLVGYPRIAPPTGTCPDVLPFADGDLRWLDDIEQTLNSALAQAATEDGNTTFVDMYPASLGHDACAGADAWIQGKDINPAQAMAYHPFRSGMAGVAAEIARTLGAGGTSTVTLLTQAGHGR